MCDALPVRAENGIGRDVRSQEEDERKTNRM
jgi:hypothetical protein